ncbi:hypothetical protein POX_b02574 [Penicillium oxalicum]|uniref:hypothetical protein n=1 Tax=Penicillium oxalicum TaxID=69781 RepID=UPI0020B70EFD|nr:hypothetical protein POX_b02574 [Penicillium oxalicum]KAI2792536.1 hypothetical protein POX_b02574 [Penicillium oxalicum]
MARQAQTCLTHMVIWMKPHNSQLDGSEATSIKMVDIHYFHWDWRENGFFEPVVCQVVSCFC